MPKNKFVDQSALTNEASVEALFVNPLLEKLGYTHSDILFKTSISEMAVGKGSKKVLYKPDYVLTTGGIPSIVIDAKAPTEDISKWESQCASYCLEINKNFDYNPVTLFVLTNGLKLKLHQWDKKAELLELDFEDFADGNAKFKALVDALSRQTVRENAKEALASIENEAFEFQPAGLEVLSDVFRRMHNTIWRAEKKSPSAAFQELIKIIFVKIEKDRQLHEKLGSNPKPKYKDVIFSSHWLSNQTENESPINDPLFRNLVKSLEKDILSGAKKRLFKEDEQLEISPSTIKRLVKEIEHIDFYAMEEDIHGRMFEAFLDATVRGKDIGQFFTPRDIVELMVEIASPRANKQKIDKVLDACCGSGGFLISSMRYMLTQAQRLVGTSSDEKEKIVKKIKNESIFGIDAGSDPAMYRIARMNMYLHGDGGSKIYYADSLDKRIGKVGSGSNENDKQIEEIRKQLVNERLKFDVILSNPPFSLSYSRDDQDQAEILNQYGLSVDRDNGKIISNLPSSVLFIERYKDLIAEDGTIVAIIDDSVLSGDSYSYVRNFVRQNFIIKAIISLPGDAFQRASARVKTSILVLTPKKTGETQEDVFMTSSIYLGVEEKTARRIGIDAARLPVLKQAEIARIIADYRSYVAGIPGGYTTPFTALADRMDVKYCVHDRGRKTAEWVKAGYTTVLIGEVLHVQSDRSVDVDDDEIYQLLRVTYDGNILDGDEVIGSDSSYNKFKQVREFDILVSNIGVGRGAVGIVPSFHAGKFVSNEYTILRANSKEEAVYYTSLLRTKEILGDVLASTTGMNRGRIKWDVISTVQVPKYKVGTVEIETLVKELEKFWKAFEDFTSKHKEHVTKVAGALKVEEQDSVERWLSYKPPE